MVLEAVVKNSRHFLSAVREALLLWLVRESATLLQCVYFFRLVIFYQDSLLKNAAGLTT